MDKEKQQRWNEYLKIHNKTSVSSVLRSPYSAAVLWFDTKAIVSLAYENHYNILKRNMDDLRVLLDGFNEKDTEIELTIDRELINSLMSEEQIADQKKREEQEKQRAKEAEEEKVKQIKEAKDEAISCANADGCRFDNFKVNPINKSAVQICKDWASIVDPELYHHFLTLAGECGRGKTRMAKTILNYRINQSNNPSSNVLFQVPDLLNQLKNGYNDDSFEAVLNKCKNADLLVLDDLGMQKNTEWALEQLDSLIDYRYDNCLSTIFTTNLALDKLPKRVSSRLSEGEMVVFLGDDYRKTIAKERIAKRKAK